MKQLTLRLLAPFSSAQVVTARVAQFSLKKILFVLTMPQRLTGKWRLYLNYCPECNSCAPKVHQCDVCNADTKSYFSWNEEIKKTWWKRYTQKHHIAA